MKNLFFLMFLLSSASVFSQEKYDLSKSELLDKGIDIETKVYNEDVKYLSPSTLSYSILEYHSAQYMGAGTFSRRYGFEVERLISENKKIVCSIIGENGKHTDHLIVMAYLYELKTYKPRWYELFSEEEDRWYFTKAIDLYGKNLHTTAYKNFLKCVRGSAYNN